MNIAIVEDQQADKKRLVDLLTEYWKRCDCTPHLECFSSGEDFLAAAEPEVFDLCFMDIYMDGMNGVEAAARLRQTDPQCLVIFLTSSPDYMAEGFRLRAWRYLLKPVTMEQICEAMPECMEQLELSTRRLSVLVGRREIRLPLSKIHFISTADRTVVITGIDIALTLSKKTSFDELTAPLLADYRFLSINKGIVVNMNFVKTIEQNRIVMKNGHTLPISRRRLGEVSASLVQFCFENH